MIGLGATAPRSLTLKIARLSLVSTLGIVAIAAAMLVGAHSKARPALGSGGDPIPLCPYRSCTSK
jgi:hypothetical protein